MKKYSTFKTQGNLANVEESSAMLRYLVSLNEKKNLRVEKEDCNGVSSVHKFTHNGWWEIIGFFNNLNNTYYSKGIFYHITKQEIGLNSNLEFPCVLKR